MPEKDRQPFYCPFPGCKRKFASLWRLKVHYRAPPNERGSGKERGHGVELPICPACGESLQPKTHHNRCRAGRTSQPAKSAAKHRSKGGRSVHGSASAKRRPAKEDNQLDAMASTTDAIGVTATIAENLKSLTPNDASACQTLEYLHDLPQHAFLMPDTMPSGPEGISEHPDLVQGLPFDLHDTLHEVPLDDEMHDSGPSSTHEVNISDTDEAATNVFSLPQGPSRNLSAQGAAQVLYTIARAEIDPLGAAGSDSGVLAASKPPFVLSPFSATTDDAVAGCDNDAMNADYDGLDTDLLTASSAPPQNADMSDSLSGVRPDCTADGIPVNSIMGSAVPMMVPWGSLQAPAGMQMLQPGPNGLVPVSHETQIFLPVQLRAMDGGSCNEMAVDTPDGGYSLVVPPELMTQQLIFATDDMLQCVDADGQPLGMPVLHMAEAPPMPRFMHRAQPQAQGGIPQEQFLAAIRNTSATEVSATS